jgi:hypothetical protein
VEGRLNLTVFSTTGISACNPTGIFLELIITQLIRKHTIWGIAVIREEVNSFAF